MKELTKKVFESDDGQMFDNEKDCRAHELAILARADRTTYWSITCKPDLTEGRGWYGLILVECYGPESYNAKMMMEDYCYRTFGRPVAFVQGCSAMTNWSLHPTDLARYTRPNQSISVGDYQYEAKRIKLVLAPKEQGLIEPTEKEPT